MKKLFYWLFKKSDYLRNIAVSVDQELYSKYIEETSSSEYLDYDDYIIEEEFIEESTWSTNWI